MINTPAIRPVRPITLARLIASSPWECIALMIMELTGSEKLLFIAIVVALVGAGAMLAIQGQWQAGLMFIIIGMAIATTKAQPKQYALRPDM